MPKPAPALEPERDQGIEASLGKGMFTVAVCAFACQVGLGGGDINPVLARVSFERAPVRDALVSVFRQAKVRFVIHPEVRGDVTVELRRIPLSVVVRNIAKQVDGLHEVREGIYHIFSSSASPSRQRVPHFEVVRADAAVAISAVFSHNPVKFVALDRMAGEVSVLIESDAPWEGALRAVLDPLGADYQVYRGVYYIQKNPVSRAMITLP